MSTATAVGIAREPPPWAWIRDELGLLESALACGVTLDPGYLFRSGAAANAAFRLSYSFAPADQLAEGARRIARAIAAPRC